MITVTDWGAYFRSLRKPEKVAEVGPYPEPECTSREPWPADFPVPGPVADLRKLGEAHGWVSAVTYSRARTPRVDNGKPGALAHHVVVRLFHPESRARCIAHYVTPVASPAGRKWLSVLVVSPTIPPYAGCSITDAKVFITTGMLDLPAIKRRNLLAGIRDKVWADYCAGATLSAMADKYEVDKRIITSIVQECRTAGKAKPSRTGRKVEAGG